MILIGLFDFLKNFCYNNYRKLRKEKDKGCYIWHILEERSSQIS